MDTQKLVSEFFLEILGEEPEITVDEQDNEVHVDVQLNPEHSGIVIGYRGEVLAAMQLILSLMNQQSKGDWYPVRLNVNNYREQRADALENLARNTAQRVLDNGSALSLPNLSSYERRIIHNVIGDVDGVESFSEGEGQHRTLIISPIELD